MSSTVIRIDQNAVLALNQLKSVYGVSSDAEVMKRALAIAMIASRQADDDHNIHFLSPGENGDPPREVIVPQRF